MQFTSPGMVDYTHDACKYLKTIPTIDNGGCLIAAYAIYLVLKKRNALPSSFRIVSFARDYLADKYSINSRFITGQSNTLAVTSHYGFTLDGVTYRDSKGVIPNDKYKYILVIPFEMTEEYCVQSLLLPDWNSIFNRDKYVPLIELKLGIEFNLQNNNTVTKNKININGNNHIIVQDDQGNQITQLGSGKVVMNGNTYIDGVLQPKRKYRTIRYITMVICSIIIIYLIAENIFHF